MTVCIANICEEGKSVISASDRMVTAGFLAQQFEHDKRKIYKITKNVVALTAGDATRSIEIFRAIQTKIDTSVEISVKQIADLICEEYANLRNQKIDATYFRPRGMTRETFYKDYSKQLPQELAIFLDKAVHTEDLGLHLIVSGVDETDAHVFGITNPGKLECYDTIGYHSIGIGSPHSLNSLIGRKSSTNDTLFTCVYNVYEAKKLAENAPGVGKNTDIVKISKDGLVFLSEEDIKILENAYVKLNKPRKSNIEKELKELSLFKK